MRKALFCTLALGLATGVAADTRSAELVRTRGGFCVRSDDPAIPAAYRCASRAKRAATKPSASGVRQEAVVARSAKQTTTARQPEATAAVGRSPTTKQTAGERSAGPTSLRYAVQSSVDDTPSTSRATTAGEASVTLQWQIPGTRENGAPLRISELAGYELYYVSEDESHAGSVRIDRADQSEYTLGQLSPGGYFFAISAIDRDGTKSRLSEMVHTEVGTDPR